MSSKKGTKLDLLQRLLVVLDVGVALRRPLVVVEGHARRDDVEHRRAPVGDRRFQQREHLLLVARERPRDEARPEVDGKRAQVDGRQVVDDTVLERRAEVGRGRQLSLRQPVAAVVLDDVDHRDVAAHQVNELPDADRAGVSVPAHPERGESPICEHGPRRDRRHASVDGVEAVRLAQEIRGALARTANARQLDHLPAVDAHFVEGLDDPLGDGVVAAPGAEGALSAPVGGEFEADPIHLFRRAGHGGGGCRHNQSRSCLTIASVTVRASSGRPS